MISPVILGRAVDTSQGSVSTARPTRRGRREVHPLPRPPPRNCFASRSSSRPLGSGFAPSVLLSATERACRVLRLVSPATAWLGTKVALATLKRCQGGFCPSPSRRVTFAIPPAATAAPLPKGRELCAERPPSR